jgi:hypothetical protein
MGMAALTAGVMGISRDRCLGLALAARVQSYPLQAGWVTQMVSTATSTPIARLSATWARWVRPSTVTVRSHPVGVAVQAALFGAGGRVPQPHRPVAAGGAAILVPAARVRSDRRAVTRRARA